MGVNLSQDLFSGVSLMFSFVLYLKSSEGGQFWAPEAANLEVCLEVYQQERRNCMKAVLPQPIICTNTHSYMADGKERATL